MQIAIYGKGGIGKSTIAANISASLGKAGKKILQIGCDPKFDSTKLLLHNAPIVTVLDYLNNTSPNQCKARDIIHVGAFGVHCVEAGGPEPGVGCAGRGILTTFDLLEQLGVMNNGYDGMIYDVLGDVVCGGFAVPLRKEYADKIYIVTSGEFMSIYAANNILRGLANYEQKEHRVGGVIFNSRGLKEEEERVERFCKAVGLPLLEQFPRSELFAQSEDDGMCLMECFPTSELAATFDRLANHIRQQQELYPALPLSEVDLEEIVLQKKKNGKGLNRRITASQGGSFEEPDISPKRTLLYSKNMVSREPLHGCAFSGAMSICTQLSEAVSIAHGPKSCAHITYQSITSLSRRFLLERGTVLPTKVAPPIISTQMNESVMIFGGAEELRKSLSVAKAKGAKLIFVLTTCPSGIIGDDIGFIGEYEDVSTKIIPILADGNIAGDYMQGILLTYMQIARTLIEPVPSAILLEPASNSEDIDCQEEENLVNIIGEKTIANATAESYAYISEILSRLNVHVNCRFICETDIDRIKGFKKADLNLLAYDDYMGRALEQFLTAEFDAKFFKLPFPVGFDETCEWLKEMGEHFDKEAAAREILLDYRDRYEAEITGIKPYLAGKRLVIMAYNHRIDWILQAAIDAGMEIVFVGIMNFSSDNLFKSKYMDQILEFEYSYSNENRDADVKRLKPDILLTNYSDADLGEDCFTDTIPLCPTAGFLSGVLFIKRWSEFFRMNLAEGWRKDASIYRKYTTG